MVPARASWICMILPLEFGPADELPAWQESRIWFYAEQRFMGSKIVAG